MENELGTFIKLYISEHSLTINDLAKAMDVPHSTVARWTKGKTSPSLAQLSKLARATSTDICTLVYMIAPSERRETPIASRYIAERIGKLSEDAQKLVEAMIVALAVQDANQGSNKH